MPVDKSVFADDFDALAADLPSLDLTIDGTAYTALAGELGVSDEVELPGIISNYEIVLVLKNADFTTLPKIGKHATYGTREMRIERVMEAPDRMTFMIALNGVME